MILRFMSALLFTATLSSGAQAEMICTTASQYSTASLNCPAGTQMTWISFASYGKPSGTPSACSTYKVSKCHAPSSQTVVNAACKHKSSCTVAANDAVFGKPCAGTKRLMIVAECTPISSPTPTPAPSPSPSPVASPSPRPSPSPSPIASPAPSPTPTRDPTSIVRDPLKQPFKSTSIWNMPIGSNAVYVNANISGSPAGNIWAKMPGVDNEHIIMTPNAPERDIRRNTVGWSTGDRCVYSTTEILGKVAIPDSYIVPDGNANNSTAALMKDGRTILQFQPITRCTYGGYVTSYTMPTKTDIYGEGITGSHGGSGLSAIGGSIRIGELRPGSLEGPRHALKVNVWAAAVLYKCTTRSDCYRWPATTGDSYAVGEYGTYNNNTNTAMKMGTLLAIPRSVSISSLGLETIPAKQLAWTLQNYGAYIVDDTAAPGFDFNLETGPNGSKEAEFERDWGFPFMQKVEAAGRSPWVRDIQRLVQALKAVNNNSATSIGGGGTPLQPLAPELVAP